MIRIITAPMIQEKMAAGPASPAAVIAPNSHPEPMIEPTPENSRLVVPRCLGMLGCWADCGSRAAVVVIVGLPEIELPDLRPGHTADTRFRPIRRAGSDRPGAGAAPDGGVGRGRPPAPA